MLKRLGRGAAVLALAACAFPAAALGAPPPNDNFEQATALGGPGGAVNGTVAEATRQSGEPNHAGAPTPRTVWYTLTPQANQRLALSTCRSDFDTVIAVYTGANLGSLRQVTSNDDACGVGSRVSFAATAGETYRVAVASLTELEPPSRGTFELRLDLAVRPPNDDFADAVRLRTPGEYAGSNLEATSELGEPSHGQSDKSVWFRYRPRRTQVVTFDTIGSSFDTILAVYRGRSLNRLRRVRRNDDGGGETASQVRFRARRGVTYHIAVDGCCGGSGDYILNFSDGGVRGVGLTFRLEEGQTLTSARERGVRAVVGCRRRCRLRLEAVVGRRTARELGLRSRVLASARGTLRAGAIDRPATLRFTRAARRAIAQRQSLSLVVRAVLVGSTAEDRSIATRINLTG